MITNVEDFFTKGCGRCDRFATPDCSTRFWLQGLRDLRRVARDAGLQETVKWGHPCYMHAGRNILIIGAFRGDFRLTFFNAALLSDPQGLLEKQGPNTQIPDAMRFTDNAQVTAMEPAIRAYIAEAMGHADAGVLPPKVQVDIALPDELVQALDADPALAEAFHALTPGRQKSYVINLNGTASPATRRTRIAKFHGKILAGKGALDR
jgi:uncharacterized protein YdeI (YjbR/CyaY-like superfamily)